MTGLIYFHVVGKAPGLDADEFNKKAVANCTILIRQSTVD